MRGFGLALLFVVIAGLAAWIWTDRSTSSPRIVVKEAVLSPIQDQPGMGHLELVIENGLVPNLLMDARSPEALSISIVGATGPVAIPAGATPTLSGIGVHMMVMGLEGEVAQGREVPIILNFDPAGEIRAAARIGVSANPHALHRMGTTSRTSLVTEGTPRPQVSLLVTPVSEGWEVEARVRDFTFVAESDTPEHIPGQGHAHIYLNGLKLQRLYKTHTRIGALPPGQHEVRITLNTNTHMAYRNASGPIEARAIIIAK